KKGICNDNGRESVNTPCRNTPMEHSICNRPLCCSFTARFKAKWRSLEVVHRFNNRPEHDTGTHTCTEYHRSITKISKSRLSLSEFYSSILSKSKPYKQDKKTECHKLEYPIHS